MCRVDDRPRLPQGTFVEFKRYSVMDLSGQQVQYGPPPNPDKTPVLRKPSVQQVLDKMDWKLLWSATNKSELLGAHVRKLGTL